ncbi:1-deoxy-D-xylulose-5-phosphate reductoisomerase [Corticibacter populi]|uniref:1-deoxy-D-xylulose 5-phosphate reductoisomerase n=1 Tax=Corticibacter populi TaxID=1550736 RepID=A0A3M6QT24_9BURK|nr:1-deoxy-D-xylulose-5-phosphate reductoisomerase [Corticibacter populi]RMX05622.1 1-deoxy-D-xylulose-5-phosphate reductoisomerase [Corticibacter populi]RZS31106.1 1-deoxy-D-xylulose 5-phosphate reductoisomerase [Corticibacter populi]
MNPACLTHPSGPQHRQRIAILGSTGSIGTSTLDVLARHPERFEVFALAAGRNVDRLLAQCLQFRPRYAAVLEPDAAQALQRQLREEGLATEVLAGAPAMVQLAAHTEVDAVMAAIVGVAGLPPALAAARAGKRLLLANKEALVVGGHYFMQQVREGGALLLPIDSEHSAVFQSLPEDPASWPRRVEKLILTASGGPFRLRDPASLAEVTPEQACAHPNWSMGRKISVDSATMMNKALEVIEARYLFDMAPEYIEVVIHPQSTIHSMVQFRDGSVVAQLGSPDMRVPIAYGLSWPERIESGAARLDFRTLAAMTFESFEDPLHQRRFPCMALAWQALRGPAGSTAILNAANEVAVELFLQRRLRFDQIHAVNAETLQRIEPQDTDSLEGLLALDAQARQQALALARTLAF